MEDVVAIKVDRNEETVIIELTRDITEDEGDKQFRREAHVMDVGAAAALFVLIQKTNPTEEDTQLGFHQVSASWVHPDYRGLYDDVSAHS